MAKTIFFYLAARLLLSGSIADSQVRQSSPEPYGCFLSNIPTEWAFDNPPGSIERSSASFSAVGWDTMNLDFRNEQVAPIEALKLVVEYFDKEGDLVVRVPMSAHVNPAVAHLPSNALRPSGSWGAPLKKHDAELMVGEEQSVRTGHCPVRAKVTFTSVQFTDGNIRTYSAPEWRLDPSPEAVPLLDDIPDLPVQPPVSLQAKLRISASGEILDVVADGPADARLLAWVRGVMQKGWKFHPAIVNGQPIESELPSLFEVYAKGTTRFVETDPILKPMTLIRFVWSHDISSAYDTKPDRLMVIYGVLKEGTGPLDRQF